MTKQQAAKMVMLLCAAYPMVFSYYTEDEADLLVNLWQEACGEYSYEDARNALVEYIRRDSKGRFPVPGQIISIIREVGQETAEGGDADDEN